MRLTIKIAFALVLTLALFFSIHSWQLVQRERVQIKASLSREARMIAETLQTIVNDVWQQQGEDAALTFLSKAGNLGRGLHARWVWLEGETIARYAPLEDPKLDAAVDGEIITLLAETHDGKDYLFTYMPIRTLDNRLGGIEVSESLADMQGYVSESMRRSAFMLSAAVACSLLLIAMLGSFWVDRPVKRLAAEADRIASGDFSESAREFGQDEFGELAGALDRMRGQLANARDADQIRLETLEKLRHTERLATLGRLSAGMAHELGTPLNVIAGRAKMLGRSDADDEIKRSAGIIGEQAERMTGIMQQLLNFARRSPPRMAPLQLEQLVKTVSELLLPAAHSQGIELTWANRNPGTRVSADAAQLQQVLVNLAMNAIHAMPTGGDLVFDIFEPGPVEPPTEIETGGVWIALAVRDTGSGIDPEHLEHLFDPFFSTKQVGEGTGLGLSIAWGIAREHGGWIGVESQPGDGSCFTLYLPELPPETPS
jgi:signal transduction histidine kinase